MSGYVAFHLCRHCLPKYSFGVSSILRYKGFVVFGQRLYCIKLSLEASIPMTAIAACSKMYQGASLVSQLTLLSAKKKNASEMSTSEVVCCK